MTSGQRRAVDRLPPGTICLFGGRGFLGSALRARLAGAGRTVFAVGRSPALRHDPCYVPLNALDGLKAKLSGDRVAAVVDLAYSTVPSTSFADPVADLTENLRGIIQRLDFARAVAPAHYLFISSGGTVYGDTGQQPAREDSPTRPWVPYGITKLSGEHYAFMYAQVHGLPLTIVRPSNIFGPGQRPFRGQGLVATAMGAALTGRPLAIYGDGSAVRDYLPVDDFVEGAIAILSLSPRQRTFNLGSGRGTSVDTLLQRIRAIAARDGFRLNVEWQPPRPFDLPYNVLDPGALQAASGWRPTVTTDEALAACWQWLRQA